jgi:hypothetical protein
MSFAARSYFIPQFKGCDIALGLEGSPYIATYSWSNGFGTRYPDPATLPFSSVITLEFHPDGKYLVFGDRSFSSNSYIWDTDTGFGIQQRADTFTAFENRIRFSSSGKYLATATREGQQSGWLILWTNTGSGFGQRFASRTNNLDEQQPGVTREGSGVDISPDERYLVFTSRLTSVNYPRVYPISESGFGTRLPSPSPSFTSEYVLFSPKGDVVYFANSTSPTIRAYAFNDGFGTKFSDPVGVSEATLAYAISVSPDGKAIAFISLTAEPPPSSRAFAYEWNNGFGARYSNPATLTPGFNTLRFSPSGSEIAFGLDNSPYIHVYSWTNESGFGTKFADPASPITSRVRDIAWKAP